MKRPIFLYSCDPQPTPRMPRDWALKDYRRTIVVPRPSPRFVCAGRVIFWALMALAGYHALQLAGLLS